MNGVADLYRVAGRYTDYRELLADPLVDAVAICTFDHASVVAEALAAGKHVLVEKPLAFTAEEAAPLVQAAAERGVVAMVGYMKRYDRAFELALKRISEMGKPRSIQIHDFAGRFDRYGQLYEQIRVDDVSNHGTASKAAIRNRIETSLGSSHARYAPLLQTFLMLGSHDLSVLRGAFGAPERVAFARPVGDGQLLAILDYPDNVPCILEIGIGTQYEWWDEYLSVHGDREELRLEFAHPYVRYLPSTIRIREAVAGSPSERIIPVSSEEPFRLQWMHFADCIRNGVKLRTPLSEGLSDIELAREIILAMPSEGGTSGQELSPPFPTQSSWSRILA
jgi:predicted dehydrogenase